MYKADSKMTDLICMILTGNALCESAAAFFAE